MTVSILQALAMLPDGAAGVALTHAEFAGYLRDKAKLNGADEQARNERHALRDRLFRDGGDDDMVGIVRKLYQADEVRQKREAVVPITKFSNTTKRIVGELSTVYAEPARRYVDGGTENQARYDALLEALAFDEQMAVVNQMLNLHRVVLVGPRVRRNPDGSREMVLDIVTPSMARAICNPLDRTQVLGWLVRVDMPLARTPDAWGGKKPEWVLWTDHEWAYLDDQLAPISWTPHPLGINRWVPISYAATATPGFWPGREGEDLVAAHLTGWLAAILMVKETKSNTKQPIVSGDTSAMAKAQVSDSDTPIALPEGVSVTTIDVGTDPDVFIKTESHVLKRAGNNYGLSMDVIEQQGAQSADAREIVLAPLRERRRKQLTIMRRAERRIAAVMERVAAVDLPAEQQFSAEGWRMDFAETVVLMSKKERLEVFEHERRLGLTDTEAFLMAEDTDLTAEQAREKIARHIGNETSRVAAMKALIAVSGSMGTDTPDGKSGTGGAPDDQPDENAPPMRQAA